MAKGHRKLSHSIRFACFLIVIVDWYTRNSIVYEISHETPRMPPDIGLFRLPLLYLTPPAEGFPWADHGESLHDPPKMLNVQNREKILPKRLTV